MFFSVSNHFYFSPIEVSNFFSKDFICLFDMALYPFDTQYCRATFLLKGTDRQLVTLVNGTLTFAGSYNVLQYVIRDIKFQRNMVIQIIQ